MNTRRTRAAGFTLLETLVVIVIGMLSLLAVVSLTRTTDALTTQAHDHLEAEGRLRGGLQQLCNVLRGVGTDTLDGFDPLDDTASAPTFERIVELGDGFPIWSGPEGLEWRAALQPFPGVSHPGAVWLASPSGDRLVAANVPYDGFVVRRDGDALLVSLKVYHRGRQGAVLEVAGETAVTGRNVP